MMDAESQPLLEPINPDVRQRRFRPLTFAEVQATREQVHWSRARCFLVFFFWCAIAASLSLVASIVVTSPSCHSDAGASVPPVHMTLAPLIARSKSANDVFEFMAL